MIIPILIAAAIALSARARRRQIGAAKVGLRADQDRYATIGAEEQQVLDLMKRGERQAAIELARERRARLTRRRRERLRWGG